MVRPAGRPGGRIATLTLVVTLSWQAAASTPDEASLVVEKVAPGVWIHTSWQTLDNGARFPANGLVVEYGSESLLVDTAWGNDRTKDLLDWIDIELKRPVALAIATHFHDDSMGGADILAQREIPLYAHPLTVDIARDHGLTEPLPLDELATDSVASIAGIEVFYPGPGHSVDNVVVWVPSAQLLFGTCAVRSPRFPGKGNTADADMDNWPVAIRAVRQQYPGVRIVVPGHGVAGDDSLLTHTIALFDW